MNEELKATCLSDGVDGVWLDATDDDSAHCLLYGDAAVLCADSGCYDSVTASCASKELCDANAPSSAGLVIAIVVCLLAAVAVGILVYCLCCKSDGDADEDFKQQK